MQLVLQGAYLNFFPDLRDYVERRLGYALNRCKSSVRHATVSLKNKKASGQVTEWTCAIEVRIRARAKLVVKAISTLPSGAIDDAVGRLAEVAARVARPKTPEKRPRLVEVQPQWGGRSLPLAPAAGRSRRH